MGFKTTSEHETTFCPGCNRRLNRQAASVPVADWQKLTVCVYCGELIDYRPGKPKILSKADFLLLHPQIQRNLERGQYEASKVRPAMLMHYETGQITPEELE